MNAYIEKFWINRRSALSKNELSKVFNEATESILEIASRTSFNIDELKTLSRGDLLPIESRKKLAELPEEVLAAHQKERNKAVSTLCDELRTGGFSEAERIRFLSLLEKTESREDIEAMFSIIRKFRN